MIIAIMKLDISGFIYVFIERFYVGCFSDALLSISEEHLVKSDGISKYSIY